MQEIIFKIRYFERRLVRNRKTVTFIFYFEPSPLLRSQSTLSSKIKIVKKHGTAITCKFL